MNWQFNPFLLIPFFSAVLTAYLAWFGWRRRPAAGAFEFFLGMLAVTIWGFGNALELGAVNLATKFFWLEVEYLGVLLLPASWLAFALKFTGHGQWLTRRFTLFLAIEPILIFLLLVTSKFHPFFFMEIRVEAGEGIFFQWNNVKGLFFWVNVAYSYCLILFGSFLLLQYLSRARGKMGGGELVIIVGVILPWAANVLSNLFRLPLIPGVDLTPFALSLTGLAFAWGLFRLRLLEIHPGLDEFPEELAGWRSRVLDGMLRGVFIIWLFALMGGINNVWDAYMYLSDQYENPLISVISALSIYLAATILLAFITFKRKIPYNLRAGLFLFILFTIGAVGMYNASLSGDGRVLFFALVILAAILFDLLASLIVLAATLLTIVVIAWLQIKEIVKVPLEVQANAADPAAWLSGFIVFLALSVAALTSVTYLLRALEQSLNKSRETLQREQRLGRILRTISAINQLIVRERDVDALLNRACDALLRGQEYSFAWIGLLESDGLTFKLAASAGDDIDPELFSVRLDQPGSGPSCVAAVLQTRAALLIQATPNGDECPECPRLLRHPARSALALPLLRNERALGALVVDHTDPGKRLDAEEAALLMELADDLAYAIENLEMNRSLQEKIHHEGLLSKITSLALETTDQAFLLQNASERLREAFNADACYVTIWDALQEIPKPVAASGYLQDLFLQMEATADEIQLVKLLFNEGETLIVENVETDHRVSPRIADLLSIHSILGAPLIAGRRRLGGIFLAYHQRHQFTPMEISSAEQIAREIALALERIHLLDETRAKALELGRLHASLQEMTASLLDPQSLLQVLAQHMAEALSVTSSYLVSVSQEGRTLTTLAEYWADGAAKAERKSDMGATFEIDDYPNIMRAMNAGKIITLQRDDPILSEHELNQFIEYDIQTMLFVPIFAHGKLLGEVEIWESRRRREFSQAEIRLAQAMAAQASSIIQNAQLFAETRQRESELATMLSVAQAVSSSLELNDVLRQAASSMTAILNVDDCFLSEYQSELRGIVTSARYSRDGKVDYAPDAGILYRLDDYPVSASVMFTGVPVVIRVDDPQANPAEVAYLHQYGYVTSLLLPLRFHNSPLGLAELCSFNPRREFKSEEIRLALALADQVAVAIDNARLYKRLEQSEAHFRALIENAAEGVAILDEEGKFRYLTVKEQSLTGYNYEETIGQSAFRYVHPDDLPHMIAAFKDNMDKPGAIVTLEYRLLRKDGTWGYYEVTGHNMLHDPNIAGVVINYRDITVRKLTEAALKESEERYRTIFQSAGVPLWEDDYSQLMEAIDQLKSEGVVDFKAYIAGHPEFLIKAAEAIRVLDVNDAAVKLMAARDKSELLGSLARIFSGTPSQTFADEVAAIAEGMTQYEHEAYIFTLQGERRDQWITITLPEQAGFDRVLVSTVDITERKKMEAALQESQSRLEAIINTAINAIITTDDQQRIILFNPAAEKVFGYSAAQIIGQPLNALVPERYRNVHNLHIQAFGQSGISSRTHGVLDVVSGLRSNGDEFPMEAYISQSVVHEQKYFTVILQDVTERRHAEEALLRRASELESLVELSTSLRAASTVAEMIPIAIREAAKVVRAANGSIFLMEQASGELVSRGWYSAETDSFIQVGEEKATRHTLYEGVTGYVARTGQIFSTDHMHEDPLPVFVAGENERLQGMNSGISLPLRAHDSIVGVLHVALREKRSFTDTEISLLTAIAEMVGNALQRAALIEKTLLQTEELAAAYDNTLAGWARALELRDELTEGHTRRVTALTIRLAQAMGIPPAEIVQIQRGAILHDIGKMGIPDEILLKRGPLTLEESVVMRRHPQSAFDMLYPIAFLRPALEIPYCHHEKWDGTGYPRGLKGDEIPLAARIFAVADVWDAITSDRPYRAAWPRQKALDYMRSESGQYFDPHILETFFSLEMVNL